MEALLGVVVGAPLGFILTELKTCFDRRRASMDVAKLLCNEISLNKETLERIVNKVESVRREGGAIRYVGPAFLRDAFATCVRDLPLLSEETRGAVLRSYACLTNVDFVVREGYLRQALYKVPAMERPDEELEALQEMAEWIWPGKGESFAQKVVLQDLLSASAKDALQAADRALEKLRGQP